MAGTALFQEFRYHWQEIFEIHWFFDKTGRADIERKGFILRCDVGGREEDHWNFSGFGIDAQSMNEIEAIHLGHQDVGDDQGWALPLYNFQRFLAIAGRDHPIAFKFEGGIQQIQDIGNILYNQ